MIRLRCEIEIIDWKILKNSQPETWQGRLGGFLSDKMLLNGGRDEVGRRWIG